MSRADELARKVRNLITRGVVKRVSYEGKIRRMQATLRKDFPVDDIEHLEPYGFTSHPLPGAEVVVASLGGNRGRTYILMTNDRRHKLVIAEGEAAMFTHNGDQVHLKADGTIVAKASEKIIFDTPEVEVLQKLTVNGEATFGAKATFNAQVLANGKRIDESHRHLGDSGGTTGTVQ